MSAQIQPNRLARIGAGLAAAALTFLLAFLLAWFSLVCGRDGAAVAAVWPGDAVILVLMLRQRGASEWSLLVPGLLGGFVAELAWGDSWATAIAFFMANGLGIVIVFYGLRRLKTRPVLLRTRHLLIFLGLAALAAVLSSILAASSLVLFTQARFAPNFVRWALSDWLGYAVLAPPLLVIARKRSPGLTGRPTAAVLTLSAYAAVASLALAPSSLPLLFLIPLGLICVAYVLQLEGAMISVLMTVAIAMVIGLLTHGAPRPFEGSVSVRLLEFQGFLAAITVAILPISSVMGERRRLRLTLERARDRSRASAARAQALTKMAAMAEDIAGVGHWRRELCSGEVFWSAQVYSILGFPRGTKPPLLATVLERVQEPDAAHFMTLLATLGADDPPAATDICYLRPDGARRHLALNFAKERIADGREAIFGLIRDVTDAKHAEFVLLEARRAAEVASALKSDFLANMSHELRTPLASIMGFAGLLQQRLEPESEARLHAERIGGAAKVLLTTVNDILLFSEVEAGELDVRPEPVAISRTIREAAELLEPAAREKALCFSIVIDESLPDLVVIDARRVRQLLLNLIGNAVKFTDAGSVVTTARYVGEQLILEVSDTGPGIAPDRLGGLFDRFSQADTSKRRAHGGTGLGLAITKGLAQAMGGSIGLESVVGRGSTFRCTLPAPKASNPSAGFDAAGSHLLKPAIRSLLVADDVAANRSLIRGILEPLKLDVVEIDNGLSLVAEAAAKAFDLILIDLQMPGLDGAAAVEIIRRSPGPNQDAVILATSTGQSASTLDLLRRAGFDGFIAKPFPADGLLHLALNPPTRQPRPLSAPRTP